MTNNSSELSRRGCVITRKNWCGPIEAFCFPWANSAAKFVSKSKFSIYLCCGVVIIELSVEHSIVHSIAMAFEVFRWMHMQWCIGQNWHIPSEHIEVLNCKGRHWTDSKNLVPVDVLVVASCSWVWFFEMSFGVQLYTLRDHPYWIGLWVTFLSGTFESFMYPDKDSFNGSINPKMFCGLNCMSNGFACNFWI